MPPVMGAVRLHHGGVPAGVLRRGLHRRRHSRASSITPACSSTSISRRPSTRSARSTIADAPRIGEVLKSGWHFLVPIVFLVFALIYPEDLPADAGEGRDRRDRAS